MCGIFGLVSRTNFGFNQQHIDLLQDMAVCGQLRGTHGTGFFSSNKEGKEDWVKIGGSTGKLLPTKEYSTFINNAINNGLCVVGHNRFATRGDHSTDNAHPFKHKHIMLVHNGLVTSTDMEKNKVKVDSHSFTKDLANAGDDWKELLSNTKGAFCFVWHNTKLNRLFIYRNEDRPMSMYESDANYLFASERGMVHWLGARRNYKMEYVEIKPEVLYSFDMSTKYTGAFRKVEEEALPLKKNYKVYSNQYDGYGYDNVTATNDWRARGTWKNGIWQPPSTHLTTTVTRGTVAKKYNHDKKVGEAVLFSLYDEAAQGLVNSPNEWKYTGVLEEDGFSENIDVIFLTKNRSAKWLDCPLLTGIICNIHPDGTIQVKTRTVEEVESTTVITQKPAELDEDEILTLKDGEKMSRFKFRKLTAMKCHGCNSNIIDNEYKDCSYSTRIGALFCGDCTISIETDTQVRQPAVH
jgi:hypothetical protein